MATTLTPAQQQALQGFLDYTKAKNSESTPATTSQTQGVASLASTPASTSQTQGVASLASTPATTSQTQGIASLNTQPWWVGQFASEADANYVDTNRNQKIEDTEKAAWRSRYDPNSTESQQRVSQEQPWWAGQFASEADANFVDTNRNQQIEDTEKAIWRTFHDPNSEEYQQRVAYNAYLAAPRTSSGVALSTIKDQFSAIYNDKTLTSPQKAVKIQQLANDNKYSNADLAKALGVTEDVLGTFFSQQQPNWEQDFTGRGVIRYINPVTGEKVLSDVYLETANTPEAIKYRTDNASFLNFDKKSGLYGRDSVQKVWNAVDSYIDPISNKDYTENLKWYLAKQLTDRGITDLGQLETQVIPGKAGYFQPGFKGSGRFIDAVPEVIKVIDTKTGKEIDNVLFDDKAGTKYIVTSNGIQKQFDPYTRLGTELLPYVDPSSTGGAWGTKGGKNSPRGFGPQEMLRQIASRVYNATQAWSINDLGVRKTNQTDSSPYEIYNKKTGQKIRDGNYIDLGGWGEGPGITYASLSFDANGKPKISTYGEDTNTLADIQPLMTLASIIPSPIQPFAIAANAANAAYNYGNFAPAIMALAGATGILDSIAGTASNVAGPAGELLPNSGIAGLAQDLGVSADLANKIGRIGAQSGLSGTISAAQGKGFDTGFTSGIASGLVKEGVNELSAATGLDKGLGSLAGPTKSLVSSAVTSAALDRPFDFSEAAKTAAMRYGVGEISKLTGLTPEQGTAVNSFLEYLGKKK